MSIAQATQKIPPRTVPARILIGWLARDAAVSYLMNECVFDEPLTAEAAEQLWTRYRDAVAALPERDCCAPACIPLSPAEKTIADRFLKFHRQHPQPSVRDVIKINPLNLVAHQPYVLMNKAAEYAKNASDAATYAQHSLDIAKGINNIQFNHGLNFMDVPVPHGEFAIAFNGNPQSWVVLELARHISVTAFQGRMLLWAGYHRSYAFMDRENPEGIERSLLVALTTDADFLVSAQSPNQGLRALVCGLRPPLFRDFFNDSLFMTTNLKRKRFVLQIRAQCFGVDET